MAEHIRMMLRIFHLMQDCGLPEGRVTADLLLEIYWMLEEHFEMFGIDTE